jgi:hypothetical protein
MCEASGRGDPGAMQIFVVGPSGKKIAVNGAASSETVLDVKRRLQEMPEALVDLGVPRTVGLSDMMLLGHGRALNDEKPIEQLCSDLEFVLVLRDPGAMPSDASEGILIFAIFENMDMKPQVLVQAQLGDTIGFLKILISASPIKRNPTRQILKYDGKVLMDNLTIAECGITDRSKVRVDYSYDMQVFAKTICGKTITLDADKDEIIWNLKVQIWEKDGIRPPDQRLMWSGKQLEDGRTLASYGIEKESTIFLLLRLRGGMDGDQSVVPAIESAAAEVLGFFKSTSENSIVNNIFAN